MVLTGTVSLGSNLIGSNVKTITIAQSFKDNNFLSFPQLLSTDGGGFYVFARATDKNKIRFQTINLNSGTVPFLCYGKWK